MTNSFAMSGGRILSWRRSQRTRRRVFAVVTLLPLLVLLALLFVYPLTELVHLAFSRVTPTRNTLRYQGVGTANFRTALHDNTFGAAVINSLWFIFGSALLSTALGVVVALLVYQSRRLDRIARIVLLWPSIIAPVAVSVIWWMLIDGQFGLLNDALRGLGLPPQGWLGSSHAALPTLVAVDTWHWTPICFILCLAALQAIDQEVIEAARVDGASSFRVSRHVLLPLVTPTIAAIFLIRALMGTKVFDEFYLLTGGGPGTATTVLSLDIYNVSFSQLNIGYGAALGVMVALGMLVAFVVGRLVRNGPRMFRFTGLDGTSARSRGPMIAGTERSVVAGSEISNES